MAKLRSFIDTRIDASSYHIEVGKILKNLFPAFTLWQEYSMETKENKDGSMYRVDWFIKELNLAIEVDGQHHYVPINYENNEEKALDDFYKRIALDSVKDKIATVNGWYILHIPYWLCQRPDIIRSKILQILSKEDE